MDKSKVLIIVPSYREEKNIKKVIEGLRKYVPDMDVLIIVDGSKDRTEEIVSHNGFNLLVHPFNMGYGVTVQTGYKYAVKHGYDIVVQVDGDGQHDPKFIIPLVNTLKNSGSDVVIGSRFLAGGSYDVPITRKIGIKFFSKIVTLTTGQKISDSTSGFQALNREVFNFFSKVDNFPYDYPDADTIITLIFAGFKVKEIPVIMYDRLNGRSMITGIKTLSYVIRMLISILITVLRKKKIHEDSKELSNFAYSNQKIKAEIRPGVKLLH
ncbi:MAG: glycosyltransferase family 2 protein [Candidatus Scalinduaceae bacterium]